MIARKHVTENVQPKKLIKELVDGNREYREDNREHFAFLKEGQKPDITLVTCSDSRVPHDVFGLDTLNEVFTIRNIGNQFRNSEGSIKYSLFHLKTPFLVIMGHTGCGAVNASLSDYREEDDAIQKEVVGLVNSVRRADEHHELHKRETQDHISKNSMYAEINVDHQVDKVIQDYNVRPLIESGEITVIGMMFDIHGVYDRDAAHFHITNVNGESDIDKIRALDLFEHLDDTDKEHFIRRLNA